MVSWGKKLGKWALIDIETSGVNSEEDSIIDVGFLQFEGVNLIKKYSSLVRFPPEDDFYESPPKLSHFIQKLTGIKEKELKRAPLWRDVRLEVQDLYGHHLVAHNASFEKSFLSPDFEDIDDGSGREVYEDSLLYLSFLFPQRSTLKLEEFICDWKLADKETHRGFEDSVDLLKVLLLGTYALRKKTPLFTHYKMLLDQYEMKDWWYSTFFQLELDELFTLSEVINFDLEEAFGDLTDKDFFSESSAIELSNLEGHESSGGKLFPLEFSGQNIEGLLKGEETIRKKVPNYKFRDSQLRLALKTGQAFKNDVHAIVQAPTGTGKTLGYLLPSTLYSHSEGEQILVATGTKTLQHQAMTKDVPQLKHLLGLDDHEFKVRYLVGSQNHLCELLFRQDGEESNSLDFGTGDFSEKFTKLFFEVVFLYNSLGEELLGRKNPILRGGLPYVLKRKIETFAKKEKEIAVDFRSCTGSRCPFKGNCSYIQGLRDAKEANVIIGNHALMFSWPRGLPRPSRIVVDEAHKIEDEATKAFSIEVGQEQLEGFQNQIHHMQGMGSLFYLLAQTESSAGESSPIIKKLKTKAEDLGEVLGDHLPLLSEKVERYFKKMPRYTDIYWNEFPMIKKEGVSDPLSLSILNHLESLHFSLGLLLKDLSHYPSLFEEMNLKEDAMVTALTRFKTFLGILEDLFTGFAGILELKEEMSHSMKYHHDKGYLFLSAPIDIGKFLHEGLLKDSSSVVFTSATLANANGDKGARGIEWATGYSYLEPKKRFQKGFFLPAVFDYKSNTKVFLCDDTLPFFHVDFVKDTIERLYDLLSDIEGGALFLFSSRRRFEVASEILLEKFEGELPVFIQGMGNQVVDDFKKEVRKYNKGILIGMESFGEGIDIPGKDLQFIFIDKIPDVRMDYVIKERRDFYDKHIGNEFTDYYLSHRTRSLHQKLGRLLRTESDRGGVIIVDSRVKKWKGPTMDKVKRLMEPYELERVPLKEACEDVKAFLTQSQ